MVCCPVLRWVLPVRCCRPRCPPVSASARWRRFSLNAAGGQYNTQLNQGLVRSAAARASGLADEEFELRLQVGGWQGVPPAGREPWCACCSPKLPALSACHQW